MAAFCARIAAGERTANRKARVSTTKAMLHQAYGVGGWNLCTFDLRDLRAGPSARTEGFAGGRCLDAKGIVIDCIPRGGEVSETVATQIEPVRAPVSGPKAFLTQSSHVENALVRSPP